MVFKGTWTNCFTIKPGLTGAASMMFSNEEELLANQDDPISFNDQILYPEKVRINNEYVKNQSFFLDLKIIIYTILGKRLKEDWAQGRVAKRSPD